MESRRSFLRSAGLAAAALSSAVPGSALTPDPLQEFSYGDVDLAPGLAQTQFEQTQAVLLSLNEDSLLKPWRLRAGLPGPGPDLGGWYDELPLQKTESGGHGFAPAHCFGQWISALARGYAIHRDAVTRQKLERILAMYEPAISGRFYANFRFPAYNYDKMVIGLVDAQRFGGLSQARRLLDLTTDAAEPHLPPRALDRDDPQKRWRQSMGENTANEYLWDESYTLPENLYIASTTGAGERYRKLAVRFLLDDTFFNPLSENKNVLANHHAYSFCNALSSAMQAYLVDGSQKHLRAAKNAFAMISETQSFATGGWGPNESFVVPQTGALYTSLTGTHRGFETPCGSYAHCKLTRYLLRVTRDGRYGDSMERVLYNTILGAKPLQSDGRAFYYSDYQAATRKAYFGDAWPCCSGTFPQVAADYRLLAYFREAGGILVNLYLPSTLRWITTGGEQFTLTQNSDYPLDSKITLRVGASRPEAFSLSLRIPEWSSRFTVAVNGQRVSASVQAGFISLRRKWKDGDRIELELLLPMRLEHIDAEHPNTVALVRGPIVLFPIGEHPPAVTRHQLLSATRLHGQTSWHSDTMASPLELRPFFAIDDEVYSTYLNVV